MPTATPRIVIVSTPVRGGAGVHSLTVSGVIASGTVAGRGRGCGPPGGVFGALGLRLLEAPLHHSVRHCSSSRVSPAYGRIASVPAQGHRRHIDGQHNDGMPDDVLDTRALGHATLARQFLLERVPLGVIDAVHQLVGLQAQIPSNPYLALWSRLDPFDPEVVSRCILDRSLVRIAAMRSTLHLLTVDDALQLRPLMQPVLNRELERHRDFGPPLLGVDVNEVLAYARGLLEEQPRTGTQLRAALGERFPDLDAAALVYTCRNQLALVQVPPHRTLESFGSGHDDAARTLGRASTRRRGPRRRRRAPISPGLWSRDRRRRRRVVAPHRPSRSRRTAAPATATLP